MHTISVLTVTQYSRRFSFPLLVKMIEEQTMKPTEWVIVEGSQTDKTCKLNKMCITLAVNKLKEKMPDLVIKYIPNKKQNFAEMLNIGNNSCTGDFIVQMEDDDYYPPTRIEHAVTKLLENPDILIAGCSGVFMYSLKNNEFFTSPYFNDNHSCNHAFAYKKSYLTHNRYKHTPNRKYSVEMSFTKDYTNKMVQLNPLHTIINTWHSNNSVNRELIICQWKEQNLINYISYEKYTKIFPNYEYYKEKYQKIHNMNNFSHKKSYVH